MLWAEAAASTCLNVQNCGTASTQSPEQGTPSAVCAVRALPTCVFQWQQNTFCSASLLSFFDLDPSHHTLRK